jgi:trans-aconitate methyltransferase
MESTIRHFYFQKIAQILAENIAFNEGGKALEVGAGEGLLMQKMIKKFPSLKFKGIDISEKSVESAREKGTDVAVCDVANLPSSEKFDLVYGTAILHHLESIEKFFEKIRSSLKSEGVVLIGAEPVFYEFFYILYHMARESWEAEKGMLQLSVSRVKKILSQGYKNVKIYRHGNPFVYAYEPFGTFWNNTYLSRIPFLNDIYIYAQKDG